MERRRIRLEFKTAVLGIEVDGARTKLTRNEKGEPCIRSDQIIGAIGAAARALQKRLPAVTIEDENGDPMMKVPIWGAEIFNIERMKRFPGSDQMVRVSSEATLGTAEFFIVTAQPELVVELLMHAGRVIGIGQHRKTGYGRFGVKADVA